jgi:hypothetical protein
MLARIAANAIDPVTGNTGFKIKIAVATAATIKEMAKNVPKIIVFGLKYFIPSTSTGNT